MPAKERRVGVKVYMHPTVKKEIEEYAEMLGVSLSMALTMIVGQWRLQQKSIVRPVIESGIKNQEEAIQGLFKEMARMLGSTSEDGA